MFARWRRPSDRYPTKSSAGSARESSDNTARGNPKTQTPNPKASTLGFGIWDSGLVFRDLLRAMKSPRVVFACQECGAQAPKWMGRCTECGAWNSLVEERAAEPGAVPGANRYAQFAASGGAKLYAEVETANALRLSTGIGEFDRVLGGGVVPGSLVLLGGEPGIGKSTLLLQAAAHFAREIGPVLYASGEESEHQIKSRGDRLGVGAAPLYLLSETCIERILEEVARLKPTLVIVDSVQTVWSSKFQSAPGSIGQVREAATQFLFAAKGQNVPTVLVGHVTKDGNLAG